MPSFDRMAIEEARPNPEKLAAEVVRQWNGDGAVPVEAIATGLDISEIRREKLSNLEGALITPPERSHGAILLNCVSGWRRQRFTLAHELCHFLNVWHRPTQGEGFRCSRGDMRTYSLPKGHEASWHKRQEVEANQFAIELLVPKTRLARYLGDEADLETVRAIGRDFEVSREAAARRFVECHGARLAVVFSSEGRFRYHAAIDGFPALALAKQASMPTSVLQALRNGPGLHAPEDADPADWLKRSLEGELTAQNLCQKNGHAMTLLVMSDVGRDEDEALPELGEPGFGRR